MVATFCPDCDQWVNGDWDAHRKECKKFDERRKKLELKPDMGGKRGD
jgi:hypothetical protein